MDFIIRKTWGWHKREDMIPLNQFVNGTGLNKPCVLRAVNKLSEMNLIVIKKDNENGVKYSFNKHYDTWKPLSKKITLSKKIMTVIKKDNESLSKKITPLYKDSKETTKETISKEKYMVGFDQFWSIYPKKTGKAPCIKKWIAIIKSNIEPTAIIVALQNQIRMKYLSTDIRYCPNPLTWLNQERWNDEIAETVKCDKCGQITTIYMDDTSECDCGGRLKHYENERKRR